jgi:MFS family permease
MTSFDTNTASTAATIVPKGTSADVGFPFLAGFALANLGFYVAVMTPIAMTLAIRISALDPTGKGASLGAILGVGALFALFANPIFGHLSDRTRSRFGRRKPWLVGGVVVGSACQLIIAFATDLWVIGVAWCLAQIAYNALLAALFAVVPDQVPEHQRGLVSALSGMSVHVALLIGSAVVSLIGTTSNAMFVVPTIVCLVAILVFVGLFKDRPTHEEATPVNGGAVDLASSFWVNPVRYPDFGYTWLSRFLVFLGFAVLTSYQVYYLTDHLDVPEADIGRTMFVSALITTAAVAAASFLSGVLSDRAGRRKPFVMMAALAYALGIAIIIFADGLIMFYAGIAVSSIGFGVYLAVDQALVVDILPDRDTHAAKNLGVFNIASVVPQSIAPAIAPSLLAIGSATGQNYSMLYAVAAASAFLGAVAIIPVRGAR